MTTRLEILIERAVVVALASCGTVPSQSDAGSDATAPPDVATPDALADAATDAGRDARDVPDVVSMLVLPDGCAVSNTPDAYAPCGYTEFLNDPIACGVAVDAGQQDADVCFVLCDPNDPNNPYPESFCVFDDYVEPDGSNTWLLSCGDGCVGRLPQGSRGLVDRCAPLRATPGDYLGRAAALEGAAADAFEKVAADLERFGAPRELTDDARRAARDEIEHARAVAGLAERFGGHVAAHEAQACTPHTLRSFAIENAIEGCVRETFGAAIARWQAARATDEGVRCIMRGIATDEAAHADLGWRIAAWLETVLGSEDRVTVGLARERAVSDLETSLDDHDQHAVLGLPTPVEARAVFDALRASVWQESV